MIDHDALGDELFSALRARRVVAPLTGRVPGITIDDAYRASSRILSRRLAEGETLVGKKIGVTSLAVQSMLGVYQPDFGYLTSAMWVRGDEVPVSTTLIQPRAEGEIAFVLSRDLVGPGVTPADVLRATDHALVCFEIVDSRIADWKIKIEDTVADNASSGLFVVGQQKISPSGFDFFSCGMVVEKNGAILSTGAGAAALGSPLTCVAWLANTLGAYGVPLRAGEIVLSGSLVPLEKVTAGDHMKVTLAGGGSLSVRFT
ncbi:MAG: fumarylacetoacetate hydrolase family protein [Polyangiaceae bacterium]|nr:fumarylacetoacetate hydrolase family protein [Polyangiaceae bacterium]